MNNNYNDFNQFDDFEKKPSMSKEEMTKHKGVFSKICLAFFIFIISSQLVCTAIYAIISAAAPDLLKNSNFNLILNSVVQYGISFPIFFFFIKKLPASTPSQRSLTVKEFLKLSTIAIFVMEIGNYLSGIILTLLEENLGFLPENGVDTLLSESTVILSLLIVGIVGPIVEEIMFRKLAIDRLLPYGEKIAVFLPAFIFGLIHGNFYQFFYAFFLGVLFSFIYVKTGKIIYSTVLHCFINIFCGVLPAYAISKIDPEELLELVSTGNIPPEYLEQNYAVLSFLSIYGIILTGMLIVGVFTFNRNLFRIRFNKGEITLPKGSGAEIMFFNAGAIALIVICFIIIALNTFTPAAV